MFKAAFTRVARILYTDEELEAMRHRAKSFFVICRADSRHAGDGFSYAVFNKLAQLVTHEEDTTNDRNSLIHASAERLVWLLQGIEQMGPEEAASYLDDVFTNGRDITLPEGVTREETMQYLDQHLETLLDNGNLDNYRLQAMRNTVREHLDSGTINSADLQSNHLDRHMA